MSLFVLLLPLNTLRKELAAMRTPNYVRRKRDGRTGEASRPDRHRGLWTAKIIVRWDDDGTLSYREVPRDFETLSFEAHVAAQFGAP